MRSWLSPLLVIAFLLAAPARAADDWKEPKDGLFTEKQLTNYLAAYQDWKDMLKAYGKAVEGSKTGASAIALAAGMDDKLKEIYAKHDLQRGEYEWIGGKVFECYGISMIDLQMDNAGKEMAENKKKVADQIDAAKKKVTDYEQASKTNTRVLTAEQRADAAKSAKENETAAIDEAKQHAQEAKDATDEAAKYEADAKAADALAKTPPADVGPDDKADYVKARAEEAATARNSAKEAGDKVKEARKLEADSKAKAAAAASAGLHPEVPATDDDKAQVKKENEDALAAAKDEVKTLTASAGMLADGDSQLAKQTAEMHKNVKEENLALVKKHAKEVNDALTGK